MCYFSAGILGTAAIMAIGEVYEQLANNPTGDIKWDKVLISAVTGGIGGKIDSAFGMLASSAGGEMITKAACNYMSSLLGTTIDIGASAVIDGIQSNKSSRTSNISQSRSLTSVGVSRNKSQIVKPQKYCYNSRNAVTSRKAYIM